jgi:hypothetical protein
MVPPPSPPAPYHLSAGGKGIRTAGPSCGRVGLTGRSGSRGEAIRGPKVRIRFPPVVSLRTIGPRHVRTSRAPWATRTKTPASRGSNSSRISSIRSLRRWTIKVEQPAQRGSEAFVSQRSRADGGNRVPFDRHIDIAPIDTGLRRWSQRYCSAGVAVRFECTVDRFGRSGPVVPGVAASEDAGIERASHDDRGAPRARYACG